MNILPPKLTGWNRIVKRSRNVPKLAEKGQTEVDQKLSNMEANGYKEFVETIPRRIRKNKLDRWM